MLCDSFLMEIMAFRSLFVILILFLGKSSFTQGACKVPSQFWCDNPEISADCGVTEQCKALHHSNSKLVNFALYYESLCPDCKNFFESQMAPAYEKVGSIMNLTLVPFGNAEYHYESYLPRKYWFKCQHGKEECIGNILETCAMNKYPDISVYFPFISCVEDSSLIPRKAAVGCASKYKLNVTKIMDCADSAFGYSLEAMMGRMTDALQPKHEYVPWVTLNGVHTEKIQSSALQDLVKLICTTYTGSPKPPACS